MLITLWVYSFVYRNGNGPKVFDQIINLDYLNYNFGEELEAEVHYRGTVVMDQNHKDQADFTLTKCLEADLIDSLEIEKRKIEI